MGVDQARLYADPDLTPARAPGEIASAAIARIRAIVESATAAVRGPDFARFLGERLTEPRAAPPRRRHARAADLERALRGGARLVRRPGARLAYTTRRTTGRAAVRGRLRWSCRRSPPRALS
jgi:50S ribosomal protein L16 3-hydroxylase